MAPSTMSARRGVLSLSVCAALVLAAVPQGVRAGPLPARPAAVAGRFYPESAKELRSAVHRHLDRAEPRVPAELRERGPLAVIVPHAGYVYSGAAAAFSYKLLQGKPRPSRVILIGPSHRTQMLAACSVAQFSSYETPLGRVPVDTEAAERLLQSKPFRGTRLPHAGEHCLEVQLPFLQVLWADPPPIVPILVGRLDADGCRAAAAALAGIVDERTLIVVSTDFTHYGQPFRPFAGSPTAELRDKIKALDMKGVGHVERLDPAGFFEYLARDNPTVCGGQAVQIVLELLAGSEGARPVFLRWANSSEVSGDYSYCVSYVAMALYAPPGGVSAIKRAPAGDEAAPPELSEEGKRALLKLARASIAAALAAEPAGGAGGASPDLDGLPPELRTRAGAFVTLKRDGRLRGCIGRVGAVQPLCECVRDVAVLAALRDGRFPPLTSGELSELTIEISVLGPLRRAGGMRDVQVGRHGVAVSGNGREGVLLPQVAVENGWDAHQFLAQACLKAGLPAGAWQSPAVTIDRFTATVFAEEAPASH